MSKDLTTKILDDADLEARLRPCFPTLAGSLHSDEAFGFVSPDDARKALEQIVDPACQPAPRDDLIYAFAWLASVTAGDKLKDPKSAQASMRALVEAMLDYPCHAALGAIKDWPQTENGKWWPTENELRAEAAKRAADRLRLHAYLRAQADRSPPKQRSMQPIGKTLAFVNAVERTFGAGYVRSWLSHRTCEFTWGAIYTLGVTAERMHRDCSGLLSTHGVDINVCPQVTRRFYEERDMLDADEPAKRRRTTP